MIIKLIYNYLVYIRHHCLNQGYVYCKDMDDFIVTMSVFLDLHGVFIHTITCIIIF